MGINEILKNKEELETRLENGIKKIEDAGGESQAPKAWVDGWCNLLKQLEAVLDRIEALKPKE